VCKSRDLGSEVVADHLDLPPSGAVGQILYVRLSTDGPQILPPSSGGVTAFKFRDPEGHPLEIRIRTWCDACPLGDSVAQPLSRVDHSAISVADTGRSAAFYSGMGLDRTASSLNPGREQEKLDDIVGAVVEMTALSPPMQVVPHVELLCYRGNFNRRQLLTNLNDVAATQLIFEVERVVLEAIAARNTTVSNALVSQSGGSRVLLRDPDGHLLRLESRTDLTASQSA
jgi:catechol 2,3-dioxygenase-like lactoylglutathione lyase family enzyme